MDPNLPPGIQSVQRNGDFQTIRFIDGSYVWCDSEQSADGEWIDGRGIDAVLALAEAAATPLAPCAAEAELALNLSMIERQAFETADIVLRHHGYRPTADLLSALAARLEKES